MLVQAVADQPSLTPVPAWLTLLVAIVLAVLLLRRATRWLSDPKRASSDWAKIWKFIVAVLELATVASAVAVVNLIDRGDTLARLGHRVIGGASDASAGTQFSVAGALIVVALVAVAAYFYQKAKSVWWAVAFAALMLVLGTFLPPTAQFFSWWAAHPVAFVWNAFMAFVNWVPGAVGRAIG